MTYGNALAALADPTRRKVFERLKDGPQPVGVIAETLPVSRPAVSQHLKVLREAGLVADRAEGARRIYWIDPKGLGALRAWLDQFWDRALAAFAAEVNSQVNRKDEDSCRPSPSRRSASTSASAPIRRAHSKSSRRA